MGVSISTREVDWSYSYGTFNRVREILGEAAGVPLGSVSEYFDKGLWGFWTPDDEVPDDLIFLQSHQDCEGILMPYTAERIAYRIRKILSELDTDPEMREIIVGLVEVLENSAEEYEVVMFS